MYVCVCMYVCMYGHTYSKSKDQPGKVANPARGQLNRDIEYFPVPVCMQYCSLAFVFPLSVERSVSPLYF